MNLNADDIMIYDEGPVRIVVDEDYMNLYNSEIDELYEAELREQVLDNIERTLTTILTIGRQENYNVIDSLLTAFEPHELQLNLSKLEYKEKLNYIFSIVLKFEKEKIHLSQKYIIVETRGYRATVPTILSGSVFDVLELYKGELEDIVTEWVTLLTAE